MTGKGKKTSAKSAAARYGIAEWYGRDILALTSKQRKSFAEHALKQSKELEKPVCPFLSLYNPAAKCNKTGGVCSIRKYNFAPEGKSAAVADNQIVTVCPSRFLALKHKVPLMKAVAKAMLDSESAILVKETPFLRSIESPENASDLEGAEKKAGRIDWILVDPKTVGSKDPSWCALETQALYFSGKSMVNDFKLLAVRPKVVPFPAVIRRPDYRSSGPKRLSPQLDVKVPVLTNWSKKVAVVIDRFFFDNMGPLADAFPKAKDDSEKRDNANVVWLVVDYDAQTNLNVVEVRYSNLDKSREALNATEPLSKSEFTAKLSEVIADERKKNKVFKIS